MSSENEASSGNSKALMISVLCAVLGGGGILGVGGYNHIDGVSTDLMTQIGILTQKVEGLQEDEKSIESKLDGLVTLGEHVRSLEVQMGDLKRQVEQLEQDIKKGQTDQRLNQIHIELLSKLSEMSDRITHVEAKTNGKSRGPPREGAGGN